MTSGMAAGGGSCALLTDLYELTMAYGYWRLGMAEREAVFHLTFRENPFGGSFAIACGLQHLCDLLVDYHFTDSDLAYLASLEDTGSKPLFSGEFLKYLRSCGSVAILTRSPRARWSFRTSRWSEYVVRCCKRRYSSHSC